MANNGRLDLSGDITVAGEAITIRGIGGDYYGALRSIDGTNRWADPVVIATR